MIDHRLYFKTQYAALRDTPMFKRMEATVEGSPWHREANVLVHTDMVVAEYVNRLDATLGDRLLWTHEEYLGALACTYHDVGKPPAEKNLWKPERGHYHAYHGHELLSARMFESEAMKAGELTPTDVCKVSWMIENHMPWSVSTDAALNAIADTAKYWFYDPEVWFTALLADQYGRISDDSETKRRNSDEWVDGMRQRLYNRPVRVVDDTKPVMYVPIAPSGAGKSTYLSNLKKTDPSVQVFSLDLLRHEFYDSTDYAAAYAASVKDTGFSARANARFHKTIKECEANHTNLYLDNTNLSAKRRKWYIDIARRHNYNTVAILMPADMQTVIDRQSTRPDKTVPVSSVINQYQSLQMPSIGEFDRIVVSEHNRV